MTSKSTPKDKNSLKFQFHQVNWDDIAEKRVEPPWLPPVNHNGDPSNYEEYEPEEPIQPSEIFKEADLMVSFLLFGPNKGLYAILGGFWYLYLLARGVRVIR